MGGAGRSSLGDSQELRLGRSVTTNLDAPSPPQKFLYNFQKYHVDQVGSRVSLQDLRGKSGFSYNV